MLFKNKLVDTKTNENATWELIRAAFYADNAREKLLPRLTQRAIELTDNRDKMRVKFAAKTLSGSMAYAITRLLEENRIQDPQNEAPYLLRIIKTTNALFDVFNSAERFVKSQKKPFTKSESQMAILEDAATLFSAMKVTQSVGKLAKGDKTMRTEPKKVPVQFIKQWQNNINALPLLFDELQNTYGVEDLPTKRVNQDCLENFFGQVRSKGGSCVRPNAMQFGHAYKKLLVTSMLHVSVGTNCESDFTEMIMSIQRRPNTEDQQEPESDEVETEDEFMPNDEFNLKVQEWMTMRDLNFILSGYFLRKILERHPCDSCSDRYKAKELTEMMKLKDSACNTSLIWPTEEFAAYINVLTLCFQDHILDVILEDKVVKRLSTVLKAIPFDAPECLATEMQWFLTFFTRTTLYFLLQEWKKDVKADKKLKALSLRHFKDITEDFCDVEYLEENTVEIKEDDKENDDADMEIWEEELVEIEYDEDLEYRDFYSMPF